jgi:hypothetical protein
MSSDVGRRRVGSDRRFSRQPCATNCRSRPWHPEAAGDGRRSCGSCTRRSSMNRAVGGAATTHQHGLTDPGGPNATVPAPASGALQGGVGPRGLDPMLACSLGKTTRAAPCAWFVGDADPGLAAVPDWEAELRSWKRAVVTPEAPIPASQAGQAKQAEEWVMDSVTAIRS